MGENDKQILDKIYKHIQSVLKYCENCHSLNDFQLNKMMVEACVFNLMQIGELAKSSLSDECKKEIKNIPWQQIYGMRNRIAHEYSGIDMNIVRSTIQDDLPMLKDEIAAYL